MKITSLNLEISTQIGDMWLGVFRQTLCTSKHQLLHSFQLCDFEYSAPVFFLILSQEQNENF